MKAAEGLGRTSGVRDEMMGYMQMRNDLESALPNLVEAVNELTQGFGSLDLHWRPLRSNYSRLYIDFDREYTVHVFLQLSDCRRESAHETLDRVAEALPRGDPFPNRPSTVTGLVVHEGRGVGVRFKHHLRDEGSGTYYSVTLLPTGTSTIENLDVPEAARRLLRLLCSEMQTA